MDFGSGTWNGGPIGIPYNVLSKSDPSENEHIFDFYYPDESDPGPYPLTSNPTIEYGRDHHILVVEQDNCTLYEVFDAEWNGSSWIGGSGAIWELSSNLQRPDTWTSADAAGLPILPGLARFEEVGNGVIAHALRFTANYYIWPARHKAPHGTCANPVPFGARFRLKADYDVSGFSPQAQVLLNAFKVYGIVLADNGGNWYVSGSPHNSWDNDQLHELDALTGSDFEAVDTSRLMLDYDSAAAGSSASLVNSILPTSRTPVVGNSVTIFNTVLNAGAETAYGISLSMNPAPAGTFSYTQTNCANNAVIGSPNAAVDIPVGGLACYVLSFTPSAAFSATQVHIQAQAANASGTSLLPGINTWLLRSTVSAGPDIIALTTTTDFHQVACSGLNAFAVALSNVGSAASGDITVSANTGSASLPISVSIQETNPGTGAIIGDNILNNLGAGENRTVAVFVTFNGCVNFDLAANRIFIEFRDASNNVVGSTSTAVSTNR